MSKQEVILCDECREKVSSNKCEFCGKDLCSGCGYNNNIEVIRGSRNLVITNWRICRACQNQLDKYFLIEKIDFDYSIKTHLINFIKKLIVAKSIEKDKK